MTREERIAILENRKNVLLSNGKDNNGIIRKIDRELRKLKG